MSRKRKRRFIRVLSCGAVPFYESDDGSLEFLIIQHHAGHWGFPKGRRERGENYEETAKREVEEEVGQRGKFLTKLPIESRFPIRNGNKRVVWFLSKFSHQNVRITNELRAWKWGSFQKICKCLTHDQDRRVLREALNYIERNNQPQINKEEGKIEERVV
ncbi:MAG: bis(5'-nucleosyl)-tetraphosphatase [Candidatus Hermodarchaeota archaeon]